MFHDEVELTLESGKGGDGSASFRREKYIPKGGPDGGDGGRGGDIFVTATKQLSDLNHLASVRSLKADNGEPGHGRKMHGANAEALTVTLPVGTRVYRKLGDAWRLVTDLTEPDRPKRLLKGGRGGLGNVHFATATHQTPRYAQPGEPGRQAHIKFELQLIADIGVIGLPNSGKSTFLSIISDAKPKIGNYPFTTLSPVLGVVAHRDERFIVADIPGLIEGAAEGKGLGHLFLRHIKRTKALVHLIDSLSDNYIRDYVTIRHELAKYDPELTKKPELVVISKGELITEAIRSESETKVRELKRQLDQESRLFSKIYFSAVTQLNQTALLDEIASLRSQLTPVLDKNHSNR